MIFSMVRVSLIRNSYLMQFAESHGMLGGQEVRNERALAVYNRVQHKLTGE